MFYTFIAVKLEYNFLSNANPCSFILFTNVIISGCGSSPVLSKKNICFFFILINIDIQCCPGLSCVSVLNIIPIFVLPSLICCAKLKLHREVEIYIAFYHSDISLFFGFCVFDVFSNISSRVFEL